MTKFVLDPYTPQCDTSKPTIYLLASELVVGDMMVIELDKQWRYDTIYVVEAPIKDIHQFNNDLHIKFDKFDKCLMVVNANERVQILERKKLH